MKCLGNMIPCSVKTRFPTSPPSPPPNKAEDKACGGNCGTLFQAEMLSVHLSNPVLLQVNVQPVEKISKWASILVFDENKISKSSPLAMANLHWPTKQKRANRAQLTTLSKKSARSPIQNGSPLQQNCAFRRCRLLTASDCCYGDAAREGTYSYDPPQMYG